MVWKSSLQVGNKPIRLLFAWLICLSIVVRLPDRGYAQIASLQASVYYVSASSGSDSFSGLSPAAPFASIAKVNSLNLLPGDRVLFRCGDTWRVDPLLIKRSGTPGSPILFSSYPSETCPNRPIFSGAQPIQGWVLAAPNIYIAYLNQGANAARFPEPATQGINQLFRSGSRLGISRWPNLDAGQGGFARIDAQPASTTIQDNDLPAGNWQGASVHIRGMRWYILNRTVASANANQLALNASLDCWGGDCTGWGYWINNAFAALDREGEWYYDAAARAVYLFTSSDPNLDLLEGSVVLASPAANPGAIVLGRHLFEHIQYVTVNNFEISRWFLHGISTPVNLEKNENSDLILQNNFIHDVDGTGINLAAWIWNAASNGNGYNGWRGGRYLTIQNNRIQAANHIGIDSYARDSLFQNNIILDIALIPNLGAAGMGCSTTAGGGLCTEDGDGMHLKVDGDGAYSSNHVTVQYNQIERTGYNGIDFFGAGNTFTYNLIHSPCASKADCGGLRTFGSTSLAATTNRDPVITNNIIINPLGNTDGAHSTYAARFAFGIYLDNFTANASVNNNTIRGATAAGLLFQNSTGAASGNTLFANAGEGYSSYQLVLTGTPSFLSSFTNNILFAKTANAGSMSLPSNSYISGSNFNAFYHSSRAAHIASQGNKTLAQWQVYSGQDQQSTEKIQANLSSAELFFNPMQSTITFTLPGPYIDLAGSSQYPALVLAPFSSKILIPTGPPDSYRLFTPAIAR